jgi:hypothetical protein
VRDPPRGEVGTRRLPIDRGQRARRRASREGRAAGSRPAMLFQSDAWMISGSRFVLQVARLLWE